MAYLYCYFIANLNSLIYEKKVSNDIAGIGSALALTFTACQKDSLYERLGAEPVKQNVARASISARDFFNPLINTLSADQWNTLDDAFQRLLESEVMYTMVERILDYSGKLDIWVVEYYSDRVFLTYSTTYLAITDNSLPARASVEVADEYVKELARVIFWHYAY